MKQIKQWIRRGKFTSQWLGIYRSLFNAIY